MLKIALGRVRSEDYVSWALERGEEGADSPSLWMLAGMMQPLYGTEVEHYFERALDELGEVLPERKEFLLLEAQEIVRGIIDSSIEPVEGCHQVANIHQALDYQSDFERFYHLSHEISAMFDELPEGTIILQIKDAAQRFLNDEAPMERWHLVSQTVEKSSRPSLWASIRRLFS